MSRLLLLAAGSLFLGSANGALQGATCYNDDGQILEGDVPCNPNADQSFCCGIHWTCLDSGVCSDQNTTQLISPGEALLARATCTDRTFKSDACPQFCLGDLGRGITLSSDNSSFCCQQDLNQPCNADPNVKSLDLATPLTTISIASTTSLTLRTTSTPTATTSAKSSNAKTSHPHGAKTTSQAAATSKPSRSAATSTQAPIADSTITSSSTVLPALPTPSVSSGKDKGGLSEGGKIGLAVGITIVAVSAMAALAFFLYRRRERRKREGAIPENRPIGDAQGPGKGYYAPNYNNMGQVPQELESPRRHDLMGEMPTDAHNPRTEMDVPGMQKIAEMQRRPTEMP